MTGPTPITPVVSDSNVWHHEAFSFAHALRNPKVRAEIALRGYVSGSLVYVGDRDTPPPPDVTFRVWRDWRVPGGWTGAPTEQNGADHD